MRTKAWRSFPVSGCPWPGSGRPCPTSNRSSVSLTTSSSVPTARSGTATTPACAHFAGEGVVELIEVYYSQGGREQVTLGGVQLTFRLMDDVVADLAAAGLQGRPMDIGFDYDEGFCVWSMSSLNPSDLTGGLYDPADERRVVEGVAVGAPDYFRDPARAGAGT